MHNQVISDRWIIKYMRIAKEIGTFDNPCPSRQIGAVIVAFEGNTSRIVGTGYNGPPPKTPHTTSEKYLREFFWPQLTESERNSLASIVLNIDDLRQRRVTLDLGIGNDNDLLLDEFVKKYVDSNICPRRLVGAKSGQRNELCSCGHAERHAITNAGCPLNGTVMFCWCGVPCLQCTDSIIQAGICEVHCLIAQDYHTMSRWLFKQAHVEVFEHDQAKFT